MISFHCSLLKLEMCLLLNAVSSIWQISQQQNCFDDRIKCWRQLPTTPIECRRVSRYFEVLGRKLFVCNLSRCGLVCVCMVVSSHTHTQWVDGNGNVPCQSNAARWHTHSYWWMPRVVPTSSRRFVYANAAHPRTCTPTTFGMVQR